MGCTKAHSPEIEIVLHWQPPNIDIFHSDPSLVVIFDLNFKISLKVCCLMVNFALPVASGLEYWYLEEPGMYDVLDFIVLNKVLHKYFPLLMKRNIR